jgi:hypothetical protein
VWKTERDESGNMQGVIKVLPREKKDIDWRDRRKWEEKERKEEEDVKKDSGGQIAK